MCVILGSKGLLASTGSRDLSLPCASLKAHKIGLERNQKQRKNSNHGSPRSSDSAIASVTQGRGLRLSFQTQLHLDHGKILCDSTKIRTSLQAAEKEGLLIAVGIQSYNSQLGMGKGVH